MNASLLDSTFLDRLQKCEYKCQYSENRMLYHLAAVSIFHAKGFKMDSIISSNKTSNRINLFFSMEAEPNAQIPKNIPNDFFNLTMTYRKDSDFWIPYDEFVEIQSHEKNNENFVWTDKQVNEIIAKKSKLAVQFVSNCNTHSKRETYLSELQKLLNLTIYGKCNDQTFPKGAEKEIKEILEKHFFYLAFENSVCNEYVTEKFWRLKNLIVPIVLKRSALNGIIDNEYFIAADDFASPKELSERLTNLTQNLEEYKKYFGWTKKYKKTEAIPFLLREERVQIFCKLCEIATKKEKHSIKDIQKWWKNDSKCEKNFAFKIGGKEEDS
uniref:Fucosyltransferase n=1 Tax=Panagrolaimus davidi TaxID=227884 RepID=A0A914QJ50_9BILA